MKNEIYLNSNKIKEAMVNMGKTQNWFAEKFGISSAYMAQLMNHSRKPSIKVRERIMYIFQNCKFDDLFIGVSDEIIKRDKKNATI